MRTRIKICGLSDAESLHVAVASGADAIGFNLYAKSPRAVTAERAASLVRCLPPYVTSVGLFVNHPAEVVAAIAAEAGFDLLQFHGDEDNEFCASFDRPFIKVIPVDDATDVGLEISRFPDSRGVLLDARVDGHGGGGQVFDWSRIPQDINGLVLAGGLHAGNVGEAIRSVRPWSVDVSSGVESSRGVKDPERIRQFVAAVRAADNQEVSV